MEFLVHIDVDLGGLTPDEQRELYAAENARVAELAAQGLVSRLWRVPGRSANWGVWVAGDATRLHEALASLPLYPRMDITVHALAKHPNDPA